jgi:hypothetical protein
MGEASGGRLSNYALDKFVAPKLSELTECNIPDMSTHSSQSDSWVANFILNSIFTSRVNSEYTQYAIYVLRRSEAAFREYGNVRLTLYNYVNKKQKNMSVYFKILFHVESCIAQMWQACDATIKLNKGKKLYNSGDGSTYERLNLLYNISRYGGNNIKANSTVPIWLTNTRIESDTVSISFDELAYILGEIGDLADALSNPSKLYEHLSNRTRKDEEEKDVD